jgi:hypothetical protein
MAPPVFSHPLCEYLQEYGFTGGRMKGIAGMNTMKMTTGGGGGALHLSASFRRELSFHSFKPDLQAELVAEDIEWVTTSTEEEAAAAHQGVTSAAATEIEIEGLIALGVTETGPGIAEIGDFLILLFYLLKLRRNRELKLILH